MKCKFDLLHIEEKDMLDFKEGLRMSLWNSDCCNYDIDPEDIKYEKTKYYTILTFKKSI